MSENNEHQPNDNPLTSSDFDEELDSFFDDIDELAESPAQQADDEFGSATTNRESMPSDDSITNDIELGLKDRVMEYVKKNWWFLGIGVGILIVALFLISSLFSSNAPVPRPQVNTAAEQDGFGLKPVVNESEKTLKVVKAAPEPIARDSYNISQSDLQQLLQGFQKVVAHNNKLLEQDMAALHQSQNALTSKVSQQLAKAAQVTDKQNKLIQADIIPLRGVLARMTKVVETNGQTLKNVETSLQNTQQKVALLAAEKASDETHLTLRAIVPGRAWLVNDAGATITVAQGDTIPHYGKVLKIDSDAGKVYTSSGFIFE